MATSRPDGEIDAAPQSPWWLSTWIDISASKVELSNADLIVFPSLFSSVISVSSMRWVRIVEAGFQTQGPCDRVVVACLAASLKMVKNLPALFLSS